MGSSFELGLCSTDSDQASKLLNQGIEEISRLESLLSEFRSNSIISQINTKAGVNPVRANDEVFSLIQRCSDLSSLTEGAFDISIGPLKDLYQFKNKEFSMPSETSINRKLDMVGFRNINLDSAKNSIELKRKGMKISLAAIGKGYAAERVKALWMAQGVESGYINASGDLCAFGLNEKGEPWRIGIVNPLKPNEQLFYLEIKDASIATSGDYEQHFYYENKRYSHSLNPKTGLPISGISSVSVLSPSAELSDGLATAIYSMGEIKGMDFVNSLPHTHAIIINDQNEISFSHHIEYIPI